LKREEKHMERTKYEKEKLDKLSKENLEIVLKIEKDFEEISKEKTEDPGLKLDILMVLRFCEARKFDYKNTTDMINNWVKYRKEVKPYKITPKDIPNELKCEKCYWYGYDKENSPIAVVKISVKKKKKLIFKIKINRIIFHRKEIMMNV
jgi:hypothetical protein